MDKREEKSAGLTVDERKILVERICIIFPRFNRVLEKIKFCHLHSKISAEPECLLITGQQGAGKTTLTNIYARDYPKVDTKEGKIIPVLNASVPSITTKRSLPTRLLEAMGEPNADRGAAISQTLRIINMFDKCKIELAMLDEFQHFIDSDSNHIINSVSNWLKDLINETKKPVVLIGMPDSEVVLRANPQLERRFSMRESLAPFGWKNKDQRIEFKSFLKHLDRKLPFSKKSNFTDHEMAFRIHYATNGVIGYIMKLVRCAALLAIERNMDCVNKELLAEAYDERLAARDRSRANPFKAEIDSLKIEPVIQVDQISKISNRRSKPKQKSETATDILRSKKNNKMDEDN